jgi:hypothetical protein
MQDTHTKFDIYAFIASFITVSMTTLYIKRLENRVNALSSDNRQRAIGCPLSVKLPDIIY